MTPPLKAARIKGDNTQKDPSTVPGKERSLGEWQLPLSSSSLHQAPNRTLGYKAGVSGFQHKTTGKVTGELFQEFNGFFTKGEPLFRRGNGYLWRKQLHIRQIFPPEYSQFVQITPGESRE